MGRRPLSRILAAILLCYSAVRLAPAQDAIATGPPNLLEGAARLYSIDEGSTFSAEPPSVPPREVARVVIKLSFEVPQAIRSLASMGDYTSLALSHDAATASLRALRFVLNDQEIALPLEGMLYQTVPGIDPGLLRSGANTLVVEMTVFNRSRESDMVFAPLISLSALRSSDLEFQIGPLLGAFDEGSLGVTCRTNMPARVSIYRIEDAELPDRVESMERVAGTDLGLLHRVRVARASPGEAELYAVVAERDGYIVGTTIRPSAPRESALRFVALGDSRTHVEDWQTVATAAVESRPDLLIHVGDMVANGRRDWEWEEQFWRPGRALLGRVPVYAVIGNHEEEAPLYDELFFTPSEDGRSRNWAQELGGVLLIGIDGRQDWSVGSENATWLEQTLARSDARFAFLFSHYPSYSSSNHGRLDEEGHPVERPAREGRETVIPILTKYGATAMVAGHDHVYERSELPGGLTAITCAGGGAPLYEKSEDAARQNPYSEIHASRHHFCLFEADSDSVTLRALTPEGELIDTRIWRARSD